jgi:CubicO group peptidase (beta-lactamase class C family)
MQCGISTKRQINDLFAEYSGKNPGAAVMVIKNGDVVLSRTYGMADIEKNQKVTANTNFRLASVTKQFTAMSVMMLVEEGKLNLTDNLQQIFPDFPDYGKNITIRHLLQHTSGLIDYEDLIPDTTTEQVHDADVLTMMKTQDSTYFEPGTQHRYSNSAYALLVMIIEKKSGLSFNEFLQKNIFTPLEMENSIAYMKGVNKVKNRAYGYHVDKDSVQFSDQSLTSAVLGDGGIYSSINDLYKWDQALNTDTLISSNNYKTIITPGLEGYGFGWRIDQFDGHYRMSHTGSTCGFRNVIQRYPKSEMTIIILTNRREPDVEPLADEIAKIYFEKYEEN